MEESFRIALSIFITIQVIKTIKYHDNIMHVVLNLLGVTINVNVQTTKYKSHENYFNN